MKLYMYDMFIILTFGFSIKIQMHRPLCPLQDFAKCCVRDRQQQTADESREHTEDKESVLILLCLVFL